MKYKQRLIAVILGTVLSIAAIAVFRSLSVGETFFIRSHLHAHPLCKPFVSHVTSDWTVDSIYDDLNFTYNPSDGIYIVHEKGNVPKLTENVHSEPLQIVVVPHSHNDPGWLWTFDNYYYIRTKSILTNTVNFLKNHKDFRMIWTETVFLDKWWKESSKSMTSAFRELVQGGQIEILSGGWVSVDEATTHYTAVLDQLIEGHLWIKEHLGIFPNTSWSIDPFGYSTTLPYLWKQAGMKNMAILRIHGAVKSYMGNRNLLTFRWRQPWDNDGIHDINCHVEPYTLYNIECSCGPDTNICRRLDFSKYGGLEDRITIGNDDNAKEISFNEYVEHVVKQYKRKASLYKHNVILMPHGDDFRYIEDYDFKVNYDNMKKVMEYVNNRKDFNVHMRFGSVGEYFQILHSQIGQSKSPEVSLSGDFFTYSDKENDYWSGYFTTRPFDKRMIRELMELLKTTEIFTSLFYAYLLQTTNIVDSEWEKDWKSIQLARRAHSLLQHHDAITGTSAADTVDDFEFRIHQAIGVVIDTIQNSVTKILSPGSHTNMPDFKLIKHLLSPKHQLTTSTIAISSGNISVLIMNPYSKSRREITTIKVDSFDIEIYDSQNKPVMYQISPSWLSYDTISMRGFDISFSIDVPPLGLKVYTLRRKSADSNLAKQQKDMFVNIVSLKGNKLNSKSIIFPISKEIKTESPSFFELENKFLIATFHKDTGALQKVCKKETKQCTDVKVDFFRYFGKNSNAYCFNADDKEEGLLHQVKSVNVVNGKYKSEVRIHHELFTHTVTLYNMDDIQGKYLHIENNATLKYPKDKDTELMMRISTSIRNNDMRYFTDSNGFQMVTRKTRTSLPIGANFYPMSSMTVLEGSDVRMTLHSAQPLGVGSFSTGSLEVMLDRIPMSFGKGLDESVTDIKPAQSKFSLQFEYYSSRQDIKRDFSKYQLHPSLVSHVTNDLLQNPLLHLYSVSSATFKVKELSFLDTAYFPCDIAFGNFRTILSESAKYLGTGLTLHRRAASCELSDNDVVEKMCSASQTLDLSKSFVDLEVDKIKSESLSHLYEKEYKQSIRPMELESYQIKWKKESSLNYFKAQMNDDSV